MKSLGLFESYEITSLTVNRAVNKLARGGVEVFNVRKTGKNKIRCSIRSKDAEKFFAIFHGSCYTINKLNDRGLKKLAKWALYRVGVLAGLAVFCLVIFLSGFFVFKIEVVGSGSHYVGEVRALLREAGLSPFSVYSETRAQNARTHILDLPAVSFCSVQKKGGVIVVGVEINAETPPRAEARSLCALCAGKIVQLVCIRGTPLVKEGDEVSKGDVLVAGYVDYGEGENAIRREAAAIAKAVVECRLSYQYESREESEEALSAAYAAALLKIGEGEIIEKNANVRPEGDVYIYEVQIRYSAVFAVNMD